MKTATPHRKNRNAPARAIALRIAAGLLSVSGIASVTAQNIQPAASGAVQGVRASVSQKVTAGTIARTTGGERSGTNRFGTSETKGRVVAGKVAGYGNRQVTGRLGEYSALGRSSFTGNHDFPTTDFVGTMPQPTLSFGPSPTAASSASGFGLTLLPPPPVRAASSAHQTAPRSRLGQMKDPEAILNPFSHATLPAASLPTGVPGSGPGSGSGSIH